MCYINKLASPCIALPTITNIYQSKHLSASMHYNKHRFKLFSLELHWSPVIASWSFFLALLLSALLFSQVFFASHLNTSLFSFWFVLIVLLFSFHLYSFSSIHIRHLLLNLVFISLLVSIFLCPDFLFSINFFPLISPFPPLFPPFILPILLCSYLLKVCPLLFSAYLPFSFTLNFHFVVKLRSKVVF